MDPEVKGAAFNSWVRELRRSTTAADLRTITAALPPETAVLVDDERRIADLSRRIVHHDMQTLYRVFIRLTSPEFVIERAARLWQTYWRNNGEVWVERMPGERTARVHYEERGGGGGAGGRGQADARDHRGELARENLRRRSVIRL